MRMRKKLMGNKDGSIKSGDTIALGSSTKFFIHLLFPVVLLVSAFHFSIVLSTTLLSSSTFGPPQASDWLARIVIAFTYSGLAWFLWHIVCILFRLPPRLQLLVNITRLLSRTPSQPCYKFILLERIAGLIFKSSAQGHAHPAEKNQWPVIKYKIIVYGTNILMVKHIESK